MAHTFRGSSLRTWLGLEDEREAFRRYKVIRRREREFFPETRPRPPDEPRNLGTLEPWNPGTVTPLVSQSAT